VLASNQRFMNMNEYDFKKMQYTENEMFQFLKEVAKIKDLESEAAQNVYEKHKSWLSLTGESYSSEAHIGLAKMYVENMELANYYND